MSVLCFNSVYYKENKTFFVTQRLGEIYRRTQRLSCHQSPPLKDLQWFLPSHNPLVSQPCHTAYI